MAAYYNEIDPKAAAWLRELVKAGLIADGEVDTRSIVDVHHDDLRGFVQCHFFAGIGGWSHALRLARWDDARPVWSGSCPCQPWSVAGRGQGADDPRDLWPAWFRLIAECRPPVVFGEQVASLDGRYWLDRVYVDLEGREYAVGAANLCAAGATAPHLRQRIFFVADAGSEGRQQDARRPSGDEGAHGRQSNGDHVVNGHGEGEGRRDVTDGADTGRQKTSGGFELHGEDDSRLADADSGHGFWWRGPLQVGWNAIEAEITRGGRKYRAQWRVEPGVSLLADGVSNRVAKLCGLGNAIVPQVAQAFIEAYEVSQK
jgi:DNA (cytosine-5)-methyltransferase 1